MILFEQFTYYLNKKGCGFMNKSNIKFLALLLSLVNCTPALGAMRNNEVIQKKSSRACSWIKPISSSSVIEKINTFGTPELDVFALCCALNLSDFTIPTSKWDPVGVREYISQRFERLCKLWIVAKPGYELEWNGIFGLLDFQIIDDKTIEISVGSQGHTYVIVGKMYTHYMGEASWYFYVKNDIGIRENNVAKSMVTSLMIDVDWDTFDNSTLYRKQYFENWREFLRKFHLNMIESMIRFIVRNKSLEEAERYLTGKRKVLKISSMGRNDCSISTTYSNKGALISVNPHENSIRLNNCLVGDYKANLDVKLFRNGGAFWAPEIVIIEQI